MKYFVLCTLLIVLYFKVTSILRASVLQKKSDSPEILDLSNVSVHATQHEGTADDNEVVHGACLVAVVVCLKTCLRLPCDMMDYTRQYLPRNIGWDGLITRWG